MTWIAGRQGFGPGDQDWGYVTVRKKAHMFWWLFYFNPPIKSKDFNVFQKPLLIWLQGGPGVSSTGFGNFEEIGPLDVHFNPRNSTWVHYYNILFIDQPVGTGFSYVDSRANDSSNRIFPLQNVRDIFNCIKKIWKRFKEFETIPTYIIGESYGGRVVVKLAQMWYQKQNSGWIKSNLKGIALGNAWISPMDSIRSWAPYLLEMGMIDTVGFTTIEDHVRKIVSAVDGKKWILAKKSMDNAIDVIYTLTYDANIYNILIEQKSKSCSHNRNLSSIEETNIEILTNLLKRIINNNVTSALGITHKNWEVFCREVYNSYIRDFLKPVTHTVEDLLNQTNLEIVVYHGHLDMLVPIHSTLTWLEN
ncbi:retinoid-inducible serine carboxypeptidase-like, partial [Chelonus insularis]|uniref:retinoid-inducible serine carboxypeptidase-like n=1 Tax=Chelonus insularis TaxID=460826 RepID=UPI00158EA9A4